MHSPHISTVLFVALTTLVVFTHSTAFSKMVAPYGTFCFSDDIRTPINNSAKHTLVKLTISSKSQYRYEATYDSSILLSGTVSDSRIVKSFTTQKFGIHRLCFSNQNNYESAISIDFAVGKMANDFGSAFESEDFVSALKNQAKIAE